MRRHQARNKTLFVGTYEPTRVVCVTLLYLVGALFHFFISLLIYFFIYFPPHIQPEDWLFSFPENCLSA